MIFQKVMGEQKTKKIIITLLFLLVTFLISKPINALQAYGNNSYGECKYSEGCEDHPNSTVVTVPPSTNNPTEGRAFSVNIKNGQVFNTSTYLIKITPNFSSSQIYKVVLLQNLVEIGASYKISGDSYEINWDVPEPGRYNLTVKMYLNDGKIIESVFNVDTVKKTEEGITSNQTKKTEPSNKLTSEPGSSLLSRLLKPVPKQVAYFMPYGLIIAIGLILLVLLIQTKNQISYILAMIELLKKDKLLFEEKATFIKLVSHHIRTPMTILKGGVEAYNFENPKVDLADAMATVRQLSLKTEELLSDAQQNKQLQKISSPDIKKSIGLLYKSWKLILPIAVSLGLIVLLNYLFIIAGRTEFIVPNIIVQAILAVALVAGLLVLLQRRRNNIIEERHIKRQHNYQLELDKARNNFIKQSASKITPLLIAAKQACQKVIPTDSRENIDEAFTRLGSLLERFNLASELEKGKVEAAFTDVKPGELLESAFSVKKKDIQSKNLKTSILGSQISLIQNEYLLLYVLSALADNAVGYADVGTNITAEVKYFGKNNVDISIKDKGLTIKPSKIESLFKPFSRSDDVVQFDKQGAGINLYLSRLISKYLGGDISLYSSSNKQTTATVRLPNCIN